MKHLIWLLRLQLFTLLVSSSLMVSANNPCARLTIDNPVPDSNCIAYMENTLELDIAPIEHDSFSLSLYSFWGVGPDAVHLYDQPEGNIVGQIPPGFNFVRAIDSSVEGWIQIEGDQWIVQADASLTQASYFRGVRLLNGLERSFAWVVDTTGIYASEYPGGPPSQATNRVPIRYEIVQIFAEVMDEEGWIWYLIGPNQWVNQRFVSVARAVDRPDGVSGRWVAVDLYEQTLIAYEDDVPIFATLVSTGLPGWDTNEGIFTVWSRLEIEGMSGATGAPDAYALQSIPWVQYFDADISLHGTYWHDLFGYRRSHGCVNLSISDARYLYEWMGEAELDTNGEIQSYVYVYSSGDYRD